MSPLGRREKEAARLSKMKTKRQMMKEKKKKKKRKVGGLASVRNMGNLSPKKVGATLEVKKRKSISQTGSRPILWSSCVKSLIWLG